MLIGICQVPFTPHGWLAPLPTVRSYNALRQIGVSGLRLQFDPTIASPKAGTWDTSLFRQWVNPAHEAGMRINLNYQGGPITNWPSHQDAAFVRSAVRQLVAEFGDQIESWSFGNEPGADAQAYDASNPDGDYMRDVYMPRGFLPFASSLLSADSHARIAGCDADSDDIQRRFQLWAMFNEAAIHPYGELGDLAYATLAAFKAVLDPTRPWGISEIDHQQLPSAIERGKKSGPMARLIPSDEETAAMAMFVAKIGLEYPDCQRIMFNCPDYFFGRGTTPAGLGVNSFYLQDPVVSDAGRLLIAEIHKINSARGRAVRQ